METLQKTKTKISASVVGQLYFVALAVMAVPIMLGPTIVLMALGANDMFSQKVRIAGLPSCPPDSYACRQIDGVSIPTPTPAPTEDETIPGDGGIPTDGDNSPYIPPSDTSGGTDGTGGILDDGTPSNGSVAGDGTQAGSGTGVNPVGAGIQGGGDAGGGKSLMEIIQEGFAYGEVTDIFSPTATNNQCEFIKKGMKINSDADGDGLAQIFAGENYPSITQEDYYNTDPDNPDTDYDSYYDGEEICTGADPLNPPIIKNIDWNLVNRLKGKIVLQTERHGEAWYIYPKDGLRYYLRNGEVAYKVMRFLGDGIKNIDIAKIPVGTESRFKDLDSDTDGLSDKMEEGLKTNPKIFDTDGDGVGDGDEVLKNNTNPFGTGKLVYDKKIIDKSRGKILLQVESRGEAWYVNPSDNKRYYMKDGSSAYQIMKFLSLGILNKNIDQMPIGTLMGKIK